MNPLAEMAAEAAGAEKDARAAVEARVVEARAHFIETHFRGAPGSPPHAPRNQLNVASLTAEEAQTLADVLAGADMPEGANDTLLVCAEQCAEVGIKRVDGFSPTPKPKKKRRRRKSSKK